ncbi:hypothetical protein GCM10009119_42960 [Algoriphagus jejuensis]|uniref:DUF4136 domain-containing protein n=1 Tax=Algoriphagus jejuensis TaxID=419934 RepID=A0ABN1N6A1_9BACT
MSFPRINPAKLNLKIHLTLFALSIFLLFSCSSIEVFKENTEIPIAKSYRSFVIINKEMGKSGFSSQFLDELVQVQIQETLENAGLVYDAKTPDLVIRYHSNEDPRQKETVNNLNPYPYWGYRAYDPWRYNPYNTTRITTSNYELLQVIVDFIDPTQDKFLMTVTGVTEVSSPKNKEKKVVQALESVLQTFLGDQRKAQVRN